MVTWTTHQCHGLTFVTREEKSGSFQNKRVKLIYLDYVDKIWCPNCGKRKNKTKKRKNTQTPNKLPAKHANTARPALNLHLI